MKLIKYIKDKWLTITISAVSYFVILMVMRVFALPVEIVAIITFLYFFTGGLQLLINYLRKRKFYNRLLLNVERLDKKYLVLETLTKPDFYEGELIWESLYKINKSMTENVSDYRENVEDFKEYVEMWIHEVKIPIASLVLMCHNHKNELDEKYIKQIKRLDNYVEQVLYYVRSSCSEKDYIIKDVNLEEVVGKVLMNNKDDILGKNIEPQINIKNITVKSDKKWLEFIINQIVNNSIKYCKNIAMSDNDTKAVLKISATEEKEKVILSIYDNGIGIPNQDLKKIFEKSFTGENGRLGQKSTGMGKIIIYCHPLGIMFLSSAHLSVFIIFQFFTKFLVFTFQFCYSLKCSFQCFNLFHFHFLRLCHYHFDFIINWIHV